MRYLYNPLVYALLAFALYFSGLGAVGFVGPDEARYADVARGMLRSGDYVTPRLFGAPWFEKPPLYYWLAAGFFRIGVGEVTARLPSTLAAILFLGVWLWFARRLYGRTAAMLACAILASTLGWIGFARAAAMDMLLTATLDTALVLLALWFSDRKPEHLYGFFAFLGLATLAKGPVAVALAGMIALAWIATFREWTLLRKLARSPAPLVFLAVAAPWYLLCYARNGFPFVEEFFLKHNLERFVSAEALGHPQPFWYYVPILAAGLFPWSAMLLLPIFDVIRGGLRSVLRDRQKAFLFWWVVLPFVFFSVSENKLPGYLLPVLPPLALWIAQRATGLQTCRTEDQTGERASAPGLGSTETGKLAPPALSGLSRAQPRETGGSQVEGNACPTGLVCWLMGVSALLLLAIPVFASLLSGALATGLRDAFADWSLSGAWQQVIRGPVPVSRWILLAGLVGFSLYFVSRKQALDAAFAVLLGAGLAMLALTTRMAPAINSAASARSVASRISSLGIPGEQVAVYRVHRNQAYQLSYYLDHALPEWSPEGKNEAVSLVVAGKDEPIPFAEPLSFFPAQQLRLWRLYGMRIEVENQRQP